MRERIVLAGALAQKPGVGGHTWVLLQYALGFRRLGWDVLLVDELADEVCRDATGCACAAEDSMNLAYMRDVAARFDLVDEIAILTDDAVIGRSRADVLEHLRTAAFLLNVMGFLRDQEILATARRRVFLDIDPGYPQMWAALGLHDAFTGHDDFATIGERIGQPGCTVPACGRQWITTPQPVVLDQWPVATANGGVFTSVGSWRGVYGTIEYEGRTYGQRVHEFRRFMELPRRTGQRFELALTIDDAERPDLDRLAAGGWGLVDPRLVAADPHAYRAYIQQSTAEFMVAKNMYVQTQSGWFSDRSICYLASGKPVVAQDTGLSTLYETGEGLLTFADLDEACSAVKEVCSDYRRHCLAARALAEERFDSDRVLGAFLARLGVR